MLRHNLMTKNALKRNALIRSWWYLQLAFACPYTHYTNWPAVQACVVIIRSVIALSLDNLMAFTTSWADEEIGDILSQSIQLSNLESVLLNPPSSSSNRFLFT